jgi:hypothetical protein
MSEDKSLRAQEPYVPGDRLELREKALDMVSLAPPAASNSANLVQSESSDDFDA